MLLLTGATGLVGSALLRRLTGAGVSVRCLVRDPRRLGSERVRVQIALGDLADPASFRNALRGVTTVVHLAAAIRDEPSGSIEELNGIASWRMVAAAERAGVERFVFFSALEASPFQRSRFLRSKAMAEAAVRASELNTTVFAPSIVYSPGDSYLTLLDRLSLLPLMPMSGRGRAVYQPIWAEDVADCVMAALGLAPTRPGDRGLEPTTNGTERRSNGPPRGPDGAGPRAGPAGAVGQAPAHERFELAGPQTLTHRQIVGLAVRSFGRSRAIVPVPTPIVSRLLRALEAVAKSRALATWDEAELMEVSMTSRLGTADAERLGVHPQRMAAVLGVG
jgi:NADH dehydrogenase